MAETPPSFAGTPDLAFTGMPDRAATANPDVLSEMLRAVRLTGAVFFSARFSAPFGVLSPKRYDDHMPMAHLRHVSIFHLVAAGGCWIETASGERRKLAAGDLVLMPFAAQHKFWDGDVNEFAFGPEIFLRGPVAGVWSMNYGGGGRETRLVCGFIESSEFLIVPLFRSLPELLIERTGDDAVGSLIASTVREILTLTESATPGMQMMLGRMMELLFVEVLRRHANRLPAGSKGLFAALKDPVVGRALQLIHAEPARRWTAEDLARSVGSSRTVLAERFNALLGRPPIDYVTGWRIQLAADRLRNGRDSISGIAADVGYESEASFNRAFKRVTGMTPGRWRAGGGDSPPLMPLHFKQPVMP
jgi:AraC-like DNA-binding protein